MWYKHNRYIYILLIYIISYAPPTLSSSNLQQKTIPQVSGWSFKHLWQLYRENKKPHGTILPPEILPKPRIQLEDDHQKKKKKTPRNRSFEALGSAIGNISHKEFFLYKWTSKILVKSWQSHHFVGWRCSWLHNFDPIWEALRLGKISGWIDLRSWILLHPRSESHTW